ncbi:MAG: hypothetical protein U0W24_09080 [Bacteroidales bacterium]
MVRILTFLVLINLSVLLSAQNCKTVVLTAIDSSWIKNDTCSIDWYTEREKGVKISRQVQNLVLIDVDFEKALLETVYENPENIKSLSVIQKQTDYWGKDLAEVIRKKLPRVQNIVIGSDYISPENYLELKKLLPKVKFGFLGNRTDLDRQYKCISTTEPFDYENQRDTFFLLGYGFDGFESWNALFALNYETIETLVIDFQWDYKGAFDFKGFKKLNTLVLMNYFEFKSIDRILTKITRNPNLKTIILRKCDILDEDKSKLIRKYSKYKILSD